MNVLHLPSILLHAPSLSLPRKRGREYTEYAALNCFKSANEHALAHYTLAAVGLDSATRASTGRPVSFHCSIPRRSTLTWVKPAAPKVRAAVAERLSVRQTSPI